MRTSALFGAKTSDFSKFMVCLHGQGGDGVDQVLTFCGQGGGVNFLQFCADVFYGRPLSHQHGLQNRFCSPAEYLSRDQKTITTVIVTISLKRFSAV